MKYCINCGAQLPDEAKFCPNCGSKQPDLANPAPQEVQQQEQPVANDPVHTVQPTQTNFQQPVSNENERDEHNRLMSSNPKYAALMKATTMKWLSNLINGLFIILLIVYLSVNFLTFTGENMNGGQYILDIESNGVYPFSVNRGQAFSLYEEVSLIGKAFSPSSSMNATIGSTFIIYLIFGLVMFALTVVLSLVNGLRKGYRLKEFKKDDGVTMFKELKSKPNWIIGVGICIVLMFTSIFQYIGWNDLDYKDHNYYYGDIVADPANMIACIITGVIIILLIVGGSVAIQIIATNKVKKYFNN